MKKEAVAGSIQTVLNVSNTDIVTMLMVKQKEVLSKKRPELLSNKKEIEKKYIKILAKKLEKNLKENENVVLLKEALNTLLRIYNPNADYDIDLDDSLQAFAARRVGAHFNYRGSHNYAPMVEGQKSFLVGKLPDLYITVPDKYEYNFEYPGGNKGFSIPEKEEVLEEKIFVSEEDFNSICNINDEIHKVDSFLRDDKRLHEHIVAKMTERALSTNVQLQTIVSDFILLE